MGRKSVIKKRYVDLKLKEKYTIKLLVYFQKNGLNDFSMSKLASDFNISKTTLYNHFDSKESMIDAAVVYKLNSINDYKTVLFNKDLDYFERLRKAMLFYCVQIFEVDLLVANDQSFFLWLSQYYLPEKYNHDIVFIVNQYCRLKFEGIRKKTQ